MNKQKFFIPVGLTLLLIGCSSVKVKTPSAEVSSPQITEAKKLNMALTYQPATEVTISGVNSRPPTFTSETTNSAVTSGELKYGILQALELGAGLIWPSGNGFFDLGYAVKGKLQIIGPHSLISNSGNIPLMLSLFGNYKYLSGTSTGDQKSTGGAGGYPWKATLNSSTLDYGASVGYLLSPSVLPYVGYANGKGSVKLKLSQDANTTDQPDPGGSWERTYDVETKATAAGLNFLAEKWNLDIQYRWQDGDVAGKSLRENALAATLNIELK